MCALTLFKFPQKLYYNDKCIPASCTHLLGAMQVHIGAFQSDVAAVTCDTD